MNANLSGLSADDSEKFLLKTAIGVALLAVTYGLSAVVYLVEDGMAKYLDTTINVLGILVLIVVAPPFVNYLRRRTKRNYECSESDSYISHVFNHACVKAFSVTFVCLILLDPLADKISTELPTGFFINLVLAISLLTFSLVFFLSMRNDDDGVDEFDPPLGDRSIEDASRGA